MPTTNETLNRAMELHRAGQLEAAETLYQELYNADPTDADALHLLGVVADARGAPERAVGLIGRALEIRESPRFHCNLGMALGHLKRHDAAVVSYRRALQLRPNYPEALNNLGVSLEALGDSAAAVAQYRQALALQPDQAAWWGNLGNVLMARKDSAGAEAAYRRAVELGPDLAAILGQLGHAQGKGGAAAPEAHHNLANALRQLGRLVEAEAAARQALALRPDHPDALGLLGTVLREQGRLAEAEASLRQAVALRPDHAAGYNNLAIWLAEAGRPHEALALYDLASAVDPIDALTLFHRGLLLLLLGRLEQGWADYEARFDTSHGKPDQRGFPQPRWRGEALPGRTILLHAEQGLGDTLQFCRYVPMVAAAGLRVVLEVQRPLHRLLVGFPGVTTLVCQGDPLPAFDVWCPLLSLPQLFATSLSTIPAVIRFASVATEKAPIGVTQKAASPRVGVVWAGNPRHPNDRRRSIPFGELAPLWAVPGIGWVSLQVGPRAADLAAAPPGLIEDLAPALADFADTEAALAQLDLVVTVDSAVAHLAGTLGLPCLVLLPTPPDWRWLLRGDTSVWYPSIRLIRQGEDHAWPPVIARVAEMLHQQFAE